MAGDASSPMAAVEPHHHADPELPQPVSPTEPTNTEEDLRTLASYCDRLAASSALTMPAGPNVAAPPPPPTEPTNLLGLVPTHPRLAAHFLSTLAAAQGWHGASVTVDLNRLVSMRRPVERDGDGDVDVGADDDTYAQGGFGGVPASGDAMAALPETTVGEGETAAAECSVCLEGYEAGDTVRTMPCEHGFHEGCILGWLAVSRLCPLCRFALPPAEEESDVEDEGWESGDYGEPDDDDDVAC